MKTWGVLPAEPGPGLGAICRMQAALGKRPQCAQSEATASPQPGAPSDSGTVGVLATPSFVAATGWWRETVLPGCVVNLWPAAC